MKKIKDPILLGVVSGLAGNLLKNIGNFVNVKLGMTQSTYPRVAGGIFMKQNQVESIPGKTVGWIADSAVAGGLGIGLVYLLKLTGKDHALIKGVIYGDSAWTVLYTFANKLGVSKIYPLDPKTNLSGYMNNTLYGIGTVLAATTLGDEDLFAKEDIEINKNPDEIKIRPVKTRRVRYS